MCCILICRCMQNHNDDTIKMSGHSSLEKYTSHFIERVVCERELETEQRLQHIDPYSYGHNSVSFLFSWVAQPGARGPSSLLDLELWLQALNSNCSELPVTGLYNNLTPTYFLWMSQFHTQFNPSTVKVAPDLLISSTGCTCYLHWCISSFDSLAGSEVNMQHTRRGPQEYIACPYFSSSVLHVWFHFDSFRDGW